MEMEEIMKRKFENVNTFMKQGNLETELQNSFPTVSKTLHWLQQNKFDGRKNIVLEI